MKEKCAKHDEAVVNTKIPSVRESSESMISVTAGPSQWSKATFADDSMLEDGFDSCSPSRLIEQRMDYDEGPGDEPMEQDDEIADYDMSIDIEEDSDDSDEDEIEMEEADESDSEPDSDEEMSSIDELDGTEEIKEGSETGTNDDDVPGESEVEEEEYDDEDEEERDFRWDAGDTNEFLDGNIEEQANEGGDVLGQGESELDKGWTRIKSNGFGGMLLGSRRNARMSAAVNLSA